jgi:LysM repeat protein
METESRRRRSPLRLLAPMAIVIAAVALVLVISNSSSGGGSDTGGASAAEKTKDLGAPAKTKKGSRSSKKDKLPQNVYIVKRGDTLGAIAQKTGVPVARLQELNPGLDQFSLVAGQRIKLR